MGVCVYVWIVYSAHVCMCGLSNVWVCVGVDCVIFVCVCVDFVM